MNAVRAANDPHRLNTDTLRYADYIRQLEQQRNRLRQDLDVLSSFWSGDAEESFRTRISSRMEELDGLITSLKSLESGLQNAVRQYTACEKSVSSMIDGLD